MKNQILATAIVACLAVALAIPAVSPAGSTKKSGSGKTSNQTPPPKKGTKTPPPKKAPPPPAAAAAPPASPAPPAGSGNLSVRAPALLNTNRVRMMLREPGANQVAEQDVCLFQNANFGGWKYCSNLTGPQELPARYRGQATSMTVPDGYLVRLYQRTDRSGTQCVFYGQVGQVARDCDNMTAAISLERDPEWPAKQAAAQRQRELQEAEDARQAQLREREADAAITASLTVPEQNLADEFCFFRDLYLRGARLCSSVTSLQQISPEFAGKIRSIRIPEGYRLRLFQNADGGGSRCVFYGEVSTIGDGCGYMARAYFYEVDPEVSQAEFLAAHNRREAERATREMADTRERRRAEIRNAGRCAARLSTVDNDSLPFGFGRARFAQHEHCANSAAVADVGYLNVGTELNDNFEIVEIENPYVKFIGYRDVNFTGPTVTVTCGTHELIDEPENEITSYKIEILDEAVSCNSNAINKWDQ
jgi:hypothetical protein